VLSTASATEYEWLCSWNSSTDLKGSYVLEAEAFNSATCTYSSDVGVTVKN
jgi:hypothetical protein